MKKINNKLILLTIIIGVLAFAFPSPVSANAPEDGRTVFGETFILDSGEILEGDLTVFGGVVTIETDATVNGDVLIFGSVITIDGVVNGELSVFGGTLTLEANAVINGDVSSTASYLTQDPGAVVEGDFIQGVNIPWTELDFSDISVPPITTSTPTMVTSILTRIAEFLGLFFASVALGALLLLISPKAADVMTQAFMAKPWEILGYGALTTAAMVVGGILLSLTICLIPVVILVGLAYLLAMLVGWLTLGYQLGKMIESGVFKTKWHPVLTAVIGNGVLYLLARGLQEIPCLGGVLVLIAAMFGLGMAVVTLFGTNAYPREPKEGQPEILTTGNSTEEQIPSVDGEENKVVEEEKNK